VSPIEGLSLSPLTPAGAPAWLSYWLRDDFGYALAEHTVDVGPGADPQHDHARALAAFLSALAEPTARWYLATSRSAAPWTDIELRATSAAEIEQVRHGPRALLVCPAGSPPAANPGVAARTCVAVLVGRDGWSDAVLGAVDLPAAARRAGARVQPEVVAAATLAGPAHPARQARRRQRAVLTAVAAAAVAGAAIFAVTRPPVGTPQAAGSAPATTHPGLFLPTTTRFPGGRSGAGASFDPLTGTVTLFGGGRLGGTSSDDLFPRDTWSWDVNGWRRLPTAFAPPGVSYPAFAYDEATGSALLFGGLGGDGSTWQWNGLAWRELSPRTHPPAGVFAAAAYDPRLRTVLLATVCCQSAPVRTWATLQTWEWRDNTWRPVPATNAPILSRAPLITYDAARGELLLLTQGSTPVTDDTDRVTATSALWSFDGAHWRRLATPRSPPYDPIRDRLGYDPASRTVVLFQGGDLHTWTWNGTTWRELPAAGGPLYSGAMTTDATVGRLVLFGGQVPSEDLSSVWTLDGARWRRVSGR
jgi:hypothetical protein